MKPPSVVLLKGTDVSPGVRDALGEFGPVNFYDPESSEISGGEILFTGLMHPINKQLLDKFPSLRAVVTVTTGLQHIESLLCKERGIHVLSLREIPEKISAVTSTSEHTLGLIFALLRGTVKAHTSVVEADRWDRLDFVGRQVSSMTVGILGMGRIGFGVSQCLATLGSKIVWFDPETQLKIPFGSRADTVDDVLRSADLVLVHVSAATEPHLIDATSIEKMKPGSYLVNTSRGHVLVEHAVAKAVRSGHIAGIAVDVLDGEHHSEWNPSNSPIVQLARGGYNALVTPHLGGCTSDAMDYTGFLMIDVLKNFWEARVR